MLHVCEQRKINKWAQANHRSPLKAVFPLPGDKLKVREIQSMRMTGWATTVFKHGGSHIDISSIWK